VGPLSESVLHYFSLQSGMFARLLQPLSIRNFSSLFCKLEWQWHMILCVHQTTQKQFTEAVRRSDVQKMAKLTGKGLDPNFQDTDSGGMCCYIMNVSCSRATLALSLSPPHHHHHNHFTALFPGPPRWASARRELLDFMVQGKINRGSHTDHPAGRHSIWTNQCPPPPSLHHCSQFVKEYEINSGLLFLICPWHYCQSNEGYW